MSDNTGMKYKVKPKDECYDAPPTHHEITCKKCKQKATEPLRYTRLCRSCRGHRDVRFTYSCVEWDTWGGSASDSGSTGKSY